MHSSPYTIYCLLQQFDYMIKYLISAGIMLGFTWQVLKQLPYPARISKSCRFRSCGIQPRIYLVLHKYKNTAGFIPEGFLREFTWSFRNDHILQEYHNLAVFDPSGFMSWSFRNCHLCARLSTFLLDKSYSCRSYYFFL